MADNTNQGLLDNNAAIISEQSSFDFKKILASILRNWYWVVGCVVIALFIGNLYLRYCTPLYSISSEILVKDDKKGGNLGGETQFENMGFISTRNTVENEVEIFKSCTLMKRVVRSLHLNVRYFVSGRVKTVELYDVVPFKFRLVPEWQDTMISRTYNYVLQTKDSKHFTITEHGKKITGSWGDTLMLSVGSVVIESIPILTKRITELDQYVINISPVSDIANAYAARITAAPMTPKVSIIGLSMVDQLPERGSDILDKLMEVYMQANVDDRNRVANNTIDFIDARLVNVGEDLMGIEKDIEQFKKENKLTDVDEQSKILLKNTSEYSKQLNEHQIELSVITSLDKYLEDNANKTHTLPISLLPEPPKVPSGGESNGSTSLVTQEGTFSTQIANYNTLQAQRSQLLLSSTENNPTVRIIDQQLEILRNDIKGSLNSIKRELGVKIKEYALRTNELDNEIGKVPAKQRIFLDFSRKESIKQELYLFLLKKKEEIAISRSSTVATARIIDPARASGRPISPNSSKIMYISLLIGLIVPIAVIYLRGMLDNRVINKDDITSNTRIPILGEIGHYDEGNVLAVHANSRSQLAEQFRALRTNLQFVLSNKDKKCIMLTSSMSGEGKSFVAINLASTMAISGKKVILLELDLRKPKISKNLGIDNGIGFSNYAIGQVEMSQIIVHSNVNENLDFIPSGPVPPNPAELVMLPRVDELFASLKESYDYIVIDTAPIGLVTDAQLISRFADTVLYIVRQAYTYKQQVRAVDELNRTSKMPRLNIVANDVVLGGGSYYGYGYGYGGGYGYGYGYGYGSYGSGYFDNDEKKKPSVLKRFFKKK